MHIIRGVEVSGPTPVPKVEPVAHIEWFGFWKTAGVIRVYTDDDISYRALFTVRRFWAFSDTIRFVGLVSTAKDKMTLTSLYRAIRKACLAQGIRYYIEEQVTPEKVSVRKVDFRTWHPVWSRENLDVKGFLRRKKAA